MLDNCPFGTVLVCKIYTDYFVFHKSGFGMKFESRHLGTIEDIPITNFIDISIHYSLFINTLDCIYIVELCN